MKTKDEQELADILKSSKVDIAKMVVYLQRTHTDEVRTLKAQLAILNAELVGQGRVLKLLETMASESNLGLKVSR